MPPGYTAQQKAAIAQFMSFTQADRNTAVRHLKSNNWNQEHAVNGFFSGSGASNTSSAARNNLNKIFDTYRDDTSSPDTIGASGSMKYLQDIGVDLEDIGALAVFEIVQSSAMAEMTRQGFTDGWSGLNKDSVDKQKTYMRDLMNSLPSNKEQFTKVYKHTFILGKTGNVKAMSLENACAYWELLFTSPASAVNWNSPNTPWTQWWIEFLNTSWKKSVNKDVWNQTLIFAQQTLSDEKLTFWSEESSWPSVIDEFVEWVKNKRGDGAGDAMEE